MNTLYDATIPYSFKLKSLEARTIPGMATGVCLIMSMTKLVCKFVKLRWIVTQEAPPTQCLLRHTYKYK